MKVLQSLISSISDENDNRDEIFMSEGVNSRVLSILWLRSLTRVLLISNPVVNSYLPNSTARGRPTYPSPTTAMFNSLIFMINL